MPAMKKNAVCFGIGQLFNKLAKEIGSPVDFELPESFNKWKPTSSYSTIRRNVYLTKRIKRRLEDDGIFCSCSSSTGSSGACSKDCLCSMLLSSCSSGCKCGSSCLNKPFHQRPVKKMKTVQTEKCGMGVVAEEDINVGDFVIEYVGEVIDDKTCEERLWKMKHRGETNFYLCEINRDMVIDATYKGNKSRYINHSCCPNTEMQKWMVDGETRIGIFATCDIKKGEYLTYDYQFVQFGADQDCHCGAAGCRKKLGVKPSKPKPSSDAALKIVTCQVAANCPKLKAVETNKPVNVNGVPVTAECSSQDPSKWKKRRLNCIGSVIRIDQISDRRSFGIIRRFDNDRRKHLIMFEDGNSEFLDLSKEEWGFCNF
ncbi:histone-lysine N-methyltransferase ASHH3-like [Salvia splendens]|uniref:histone-lysine N-methyltransferase ASHH3-like n=1 Tax=Salvia splendens TaxID=180675 RepID=UPI001C25CE35|nr:histone-lysine N-methyltransferase ASHH3-like [Salvia splendens]